MNLPDSLPAKSNKAIGLQQAAKRPQKCRKAGQVLLYATTKVWRGAAADGFKPHLIVATDVDSAHYS